MNSTPNKKYRAMLSLLFTLVLFIVLSSVVFAEDIYFLAEVAFDENYDNYALSDFRFIDIDNPYYFDTVYDAFHHEPVYSDVDKFIFYDVEGKVIAEQPLQYQDVVLFKLPVSPEDVAKITLQKDGAEYIGETVQFCNNNGVCDGQESSLYCSDCDSGSLDDYCDLKRDGVCDPDCEARDADCEFCKVCIYEDMRDSSCDDLGGVVCSVGQECAGGSFVSLNYGMERCCVDGYCVNTVEYVESAVAVESQPALSVSESGVPLSYILDVGITEYCINNLQGEFCSFGEYCNGNSVEYYPNTECCIGSCASYTAEEFGNTPDDLDALSDYGETPMSDEEYIKFYNFTRDQELVDNQEDYFLDDWSDEDYSDFIGREARNQEVADELEEEGKGRSIEQVKEFVNQYVPEMPEDYTELGPLGFVAILLGVVVIVFALLFLFQRSAKKKLDESKNNIARAFSGSASPVDLQDTINNMLAKGYNYKQIEVELVNKGNSPIAVAAEIRRNYDFRRQNVRK